VKANETALARLRTRRWFGLVARLPLVAYRLGLGPVVGTVFMVLTTTGSKTGLPRHTMVVFRRARGRLYAAAAYGSKSNWYRNLTAHPIATVQTARGTSAARARRVTDEAELRTVLEAAARARLLGLYLASQGTGRDVDAALADPGRLVLVAFEPTDEAGPPGLPRDLLWLWPAGAALVLAGRVARRRAGG
jgi:deazaflavin-dependent oxidoreductase (nitroreductase family)